MVIRLDGPDVSHYQYDHAPIDWQKVRDAGCWWGATKLTQSTGFRDATADTSRKGMHAAGFSHVGLYHWLSPSTDPKAQAAWFLSNLGELADGEFVLLDAEEIGVSADLALTWCEAVEARTKRPVAVYTGAFVAGGTIWRSTRVRTSSYGARPMALAAYTSESTARALPGVAAFPWSSWQFSSSGPVPGVVGRCDMNRVDDRAAYDLAAGITARPPIEVTPPSNVEAIPNTEEEEPMRFIADSQHKGSALVECVIGNDGVPHHTARGFDVDGANERKVWIAAGIAAVQYTDDEFDALVAAKVTG